MDDAEFKRGWLTRWSKRLLIGALAVAALFWVLDAIGTWPIEGYWWGPSSLTGSLDNLRWTNYLEFRRGEAHFGHWPAAGKPCGTYTEDPGGRYRWVVEKRRGPQYAISVGLFRITASDGTQTLHGYRVPSCWLSLVRWIWQVSGARL